MKQFIISIFTLSFILTAVIANSAIIKKRVMNIADELKSIPTDLAHEDEYQRIYDEYMNLQEFISYTVSHEDLTNIENSFFELNGALIAKDEESLIITKSRLIGALTHLGRLSSINFDSIF